MLQVTPQHRLLLAVEPIDFRSGIDGLKAACQQRLGSDPFSVVERFSRSPIVHALPSNYWCTMPVAFGCARNGFRQANSHGGQLVILKRCHYAPANYTFC